MVKVIFDEFGDEIDDPLYFLASGKMLVFAETKEVDDGFGEYDFAYFEVDLLVFEDLYFLDPASDAYILENVDGDVDDWRLAWLVWHNR